MSEPASPERRDLETLALAVVVVPVVWLTLLGWSSGQSVGGSDEVAQTLPLVKDLFENAAGDFTRMSYRAEVLGGSTLHDVVGTFPVYQALAWLGVSVVGALNAVLFLTQVCCAFFGARIAYDVAELVRGKPARPGWLSRLAVVLLTAFTPTLAWRMTMGHYEEVYGVLCGVSVLALLLASRNGTSSVTLVVMTLVVDLEAFQTKGQQLVYGVVFFGLIIVAVARPTRPLRRLAVPALVTAGSLCLSLPKLAGMLAHEQSSDAARALHGEPVIFSYITATLHDWVSSVPWGLEAIPSGRDVAFWHEINFGFGPPLVLLALIPWKRFRLLGVGLGVSFVLPVLFSMNVPGVTWVLTHLFPPINAFRVPERAALAFAIVLPAFASSALLLHKAPRLRKAWTLPALSLGAAVVLFLAPQGLREVLAWGIPLALVLRPVFHWTLPERAPSVVLLVALASGSLAAFKERLHPYATEASLIDAPEKIAREIRESQPGLASPLDRVTLHFDVDGYQTNSAYAMGLSSLSGYLNPPRRFLTLEAALSGTPVNVLRNYYRLDETVPSYAVLEPLYNVKFAAFLERGKIRLSSAGETAGAAWFSANVTRVAGMPELATALLSVKDHLAAEAHDRAWVVTSDDAVVAAALPLEVSAACKDAVVRRVEARMGGQEFRMAVHTEADCPLTIATTFTTDLAARGDGQPLTLFPSYRALTAVWVPAGVREVVVEARAVLPGWSRAGWLMGLVLVVLAFVEAWLLCRRERAARAERRRSPKVTAQCPST